MVQTLKELSVPVFFFLFRLKIIDLHQNFKTRNLCFYHIIKWDEFYLKMLIPVCTKGNWTGWLFWRHFSFFFFYYRSRTLLVQSKLAFLLSKESNAITFENVWPSRIFDAVFWRTDSTFISFPSNCILVRIYTDSFYHG